MKKILPILLIFFALVIMAGLAFVSINSVAPPNQKSSTISFIVNKGEGISSLSQRLESAGIIRNKYVFILHARQLGLSSKLKAGKFDLKTNVNVQQLIEQLAKGGTLDYWIKIIDGSRIEEVAATIPSDAAFTPKEFEVKAKDKLGTLYPDSYLIPNTYSVDQVIALIETNFDKKFGEAKADATNLTMTDQEIVIFASLLEREGRSLESKRNIAGILLNRLEVDMPLQVDAAVQYARDSKIPRPKTYWKPALKADLSITSPYNTYKNTGLTPTPICNPGYNSLYAALHPIASDNIFYITGNDNKMHYAKTLDAHNANIDRYLK